VRNNLSCQEKPYCSRVSKLFGKFNRISLHTVSNLGGFKIQHIGKV
jgi:hypothetical protein